MTSPDRGSAEATDSDPESDERTRQEMDETAPSPGSSESNGPGSPASSGKVTRAQKFSERQGSMKEVIVALIVVVVLVLLVVNLLL